MSGLPCLVVLVHASDIVVEPQHRHNRHEGHNQRQAGKDPDEVAEAAPGTPHPADHDSISFTRACTME
nr:MAG TPA: hypothetical protein [Caudoviricetes sp.]